MYSGCMFETMPNKILVYQHFLLTYNTILVLKTFILGYYLKWFYK